MSTSKPKRATARVDVERLLISRAPTAELAAAALEASDAAGLARGEADFIVVAVERGAGEVVERGIRTTLENRETR